MGWKKGGGKWLTDTWTDWQPCMLNVYLLSSVSPLSIMEIRPSLPGSLSADSLHGTTVLRSAVDVYRLHAASFSAIHERMLYSGSWKGIDFTARSEPFWRSIYSWNGGSCQWEFGIVRPMYLKSTSRKRNRVSWDAGLSTGCIQIPSPSPNHWDCWRSTGRWIPQSSVHSVCVLYARSGVLARPSSPQH